MPYLLRVSLPDVPGSLGRVATAIGEAGGDIEAIEIVEHRADGTAVDDVLLELAPGAMPDSVVSACTLLDGVHVLWISRYAAGGNLFLDLEVVEQISQSPATACDDLVDLLPTAFRADWAARLRVTESGLKQVHATTAAPDLGDDQARLGAVGPGRAAAGRRGLDPAGPQRGRGGPAGPGRDRRHRAAGRPRHPRLGGRAAGPPQRAVADHRRRRRLTR